MHDFNLYWSIFTLLYWHFNLSKALSTSSTTATADATSIACKSSTNKAAFLSLVSSISVAARRGQWCCYSHLYLSCCCSKMGFSNSTEHTHHRSLSQSQTSETKPHKEAKLWPFVDNRSETPLRSFSLLWYHSFSDWEALPCRHIGREEDTMVQTLPFV